MKNKVFVTLFPPAKNVHITKGIGLIPYTMHEKYNYDAYVASYGEDEDYISLKDVPGLKHWRIDYISINSSTKCYVLRKIFGEEYRDYINCRAFLKKNAKKIDVLQIYHVHDNYVGLYAYLYKYYNPKGILYLKLDCGDYTYNVCREKCKSAFFKDIKFKLRISLLKKYCDVVSVESTKFLEGMREIFEDKMLYIPCGCYEENYNDNVEVERKNHFLSVANLSLWKGTDVLIEAFAKIADKCEWELVLVGPIVSPLEKKIEELLKKYPNIESRIEFIGNIDNKAKLYSIYRESKVFVLPTKGESFGTVFVEAKYNGCYTILTEKVAPKDELIVFENEGCIIPVDDVETLEKVLLETTKKDIFNEKNYTKLREEYCKRFSYFSTLEALQQKIVELSV